MRKFEYDMFQSYDFNDRKLDLFGKAGWELIEVLSYFKKDDDQNPVYIFYFKRETR